MQEIKELQRLEELSFEELDRVTGGAPSVKQGIASFLAMTSLLGSAANFTASAAPANAKQGVSTAKQINLNKAVKKDGKDKNEKKQNQGFWTKEKILKAIGIGSLVVGAPLLGWALWPNESSPSARSRVRYAEFKKILDSCYDNIDNFLEQIRGKFPKTHEALKKLQSSRGTNLNLLDSEDIKEEIGKENIDNLKNKIREFLGTARLRESKNDSKIVTPSKISNSSLTELGLTDEKFGEFCGKVIKNAQTLSKVFEDVYCEVCDKNGNSDDWRKSPESWRDFISQIYNRYTRDVGVKYLLMPEEESLLYFYSEMRVGTKQPQPFIDKLEGSLIVVTRNQIGKQKREVRLSKSQHSTLQENILRELKLSPETLNDNLLQNIYERRKQQGQPQHEQSQEEKRREQDVTPNIDHMRQTAEYAELYLKHHRNPWTDHGVDETDDILAEATLQFWGHKNSMLRYKSNSFFPNTVTGKVCDHVVFEKMAIVSVIHCLRNECSYEERKRAAINLMVIAANLSKSRHPDRGIPLFFVGTEEVKAIVDNLAEQLRPLPPAAPLPQ